jgi:hypothetical protein
MNGESRRLDNVVVVSPYLTFFQHKLAIDAVSDGILARVAISIPVAQGQLENI